MCTLWSIGYASVLGCVAISCKQVSCMVYICMYVYAVNQTEDQ